LAENVSADFEELLALLNAHEVRALVVGGFAFSFHAKPRYTKDLDIWIDPEPENVSRLLRALDEFGFGSIGLKAEDFLSPGRFVQLGYSPVRIDLLTSILGVSFEEAWANRVQDMFGTTRACYLGKTELIRNKQAVGRAQDRVDVEVLQSFRKSRQRRGKPE
jgi:hypothetical protein